MEARGLSAIYEQSSPDSSPGASRLSRRGPAGPTLPASGCSGRACRGSVATGARGGGLQRPGGQAPSSMREAAAGRAWR